MSQFQPLPRFLVTRAPARVRVACPDDLALVRAVLAHCPVAKFALGERMRCIRTMVQARRRASAPWIPAAALLDLEQHVALRVLECLPRFRGLAGLESWIFAFCEGVVRNAGRRHRRAEAREQAFDPTPLAEFAAPVRPVHLDLCQCLDRLAAADRELVRARHWDGLRLDQLAARLGVGRNTIKSRYHRAMKQLKDCLSRCRDRRDAPGR